MKALFRNLVETVIIWVKTHVTPMMLIWGKLMLYLLENLMGMKILCSCLKLLSLILQLGLHSLLLFLSFWTSSMILVGIECWYRPPYPLYLFVVIYEFRRDICCGWNLGKLIRG